MFEKVPYCGEKRRQTDFHTERVGGVLWPHMLIAFGKNGGSSKKGKKDFYEKGRKSFSKTRGRGVWCERDEKNPRKT